MEFLNNKADRQEFLADVMTEITQSKSKVIKQTEAEIYVDPNFELSEDAKMGNKLAKDTASWYKYFGL
jgi:hypothetical protein